MIKEVYFFNDTATTEIYTLSLHDALPILSPSVRVTGGLEDAECREEDGGPCLHGSVHAGPRRHHGSGRGRRQGAGHHARARSEEHTSELQSRQSRMPSSA